MGGFPLGACFCNYGMHKLDVQGVVHTAYGGIEGCAEVLS